ncbi:hypothetical protein ACFO1V_04015 [Daeguia caeni]|uniref:Uncharacterized protein n=1 Tax=Daeguia caeni TaxID=439612 RepID=A0ABV9H4W6_9HYPH
MPCRDFEHYSGKENVRAKTENIYCTVPVNARSFAALGQVMSMVAVNSPSVQAINLTINSHEGHAHAGLFGYTLIRSSPVPIHTPL